MIDCTALVTREAAHGEEALVRGATTGCAASMFIEM